MGDRVRPYLFYDCGLCTDHEQHSCLTLEPTLHPDFFRVLDMARERPIQHLMLALNRLNELGISTTLVVTVKRGVNDRELGRIIDFAVQQPAVRGVVFQPVQVAGRADNFDPALNRLTLTEVRRRILEQTTLFRPEVIIPVPCHPADSALHDSLFKVFSTNHSPQSSASCLSDLLCCLPKVVSPAGLDYRRVFRVIVMQFIDAQSFDVRSVKKTCVHIAHPDGRIIPFDTCNLFYRDRLEETVLNPLRRERELIGPFAHA